MRTIAILLFIGSGYAWAGPVSYDIMIPAVPGAPFSVSALAADFNGVGADDLVVCGSFHSLPGGCFVATAGAGGFDLQRLPPTGAGMVSMATADLNGDGLPELLLASQDSGTVTVLSSR